MKGCSCRCLWSVLPIILVLGILVGEGEAQTEIYYLPSVGSGPGPIGELGDVNLDGIADFYGHFGDDFPAISGRDGSVLWNTGSGPFSMLFDDVDHDGVDDLLWNGQEVNVVSGRTGVGIRSYQVSQFGVLMNSQSLGDVNNDGIADLCVGSLDPYQLGEVRGFSGADGSVLWQAAGAGSGDKMGRLVVRSRGDIDGDGARDVLAVGTTYVRAFSGSSGSTLWTRTIASSSSAVGLGDVTGDAIPEFVVQGVVQGAVGYFILNGSDGSVFRQVIPAYNVSSVGRIDDMDDDGLDDIVVGSSAGCSGGCFGIIEVHSGSSGAVVWSVSGGFANSGLGGFVSGIEDITGDGVPEIMSSSDSRVQVFSGALLPNAVVTTVGTGCARSGFSPSLNSSRPVIGNTFTTFVTGGYPSSTAFLLYTTIPASPTTLPNGCTWYLRLGSVRQLGTGVTSTSGTWVLNTSLPYWPSLVGRELAMQAVVLSSPRYQLTNGLHLLVGL